jgi:HEAT repeat protein
VPLIRKSPDAAPPVAAADARALRSASPDERWRAARDIVALPAATALLAAALAEERDSRVREAILSSLMRIATPASLDVVIADVRCDDAGIRSAALDALRSGVAAIRPRLPALLADPDPDVRILCCELLRALPGAEASALGCEVLARDAEPNVCAAVAEVLAEIGDLGCVPALQLCAERFAADAFLPFGVKVAIARIVAPRPEISRPDLHD